MTKYIVCMLSLMLVVLFCCGCVKNKGVDDTNDLSDLGTIVNIIKKTEIKLGTLEDDYVFDCKLDGVGKKVIKQITRSCGCVGPGLTEGETWNFDRPFKIQISLNGRSSGEGMQDFLISFSDDTAAHVVVRYDYLPLPTCEPNTLIFKKDDMEKTLKLTFGGEQNVTIETHNLPTFLSCEQKVETADSVYTIAVQLRLDRSLVGQNKEGVIKVKTSSKRKDLFTIPYLILFH